MTVVSRIDHVKRLPPEEDVVRFARAQAHSEGLTVGEVADFLGAETLVTFAARLKYARERERRSIRELAKACGVSDTAIRNWEAGGVERPSSLKPEVLASIAEFLHTTSEWLIDGTGIEPAPSAAAPLSVGGDDTRAILADLERLEDMARAVEEGTRQLKRKFKTVTGT